jgi:RNA polymerase sigma-70 factor, ECF subfamily
MATAFRLGYKGALMVAHRDASASQPNQGPRPTREEFEALFARNLPHVRAFVRLRVDAVTRAKENLSDILQSACRQVLASDTFEFRGEAAFRSYLCQAALHKIQNRRRRYLRQGPERVPTVSSDAELENVYRTTLFDPQRAAIRAEEITNLEAAFEKLPEDYRQALTLYRIAGMPLADLARHLGRTAGATQTLLSRAMARLSSILNPDAGPVDGPD